MPAKITREIFESYLACRYKGGLQLAEERGFTSNYEFLRKGLRARARIDAEGKLARDAGSNFIQGTCLAIDVLKRGVSLLLNLTWEDEQLNIRFDGVRRVNGKSRLGDFHYVPILVYEGERPGKEQKALLELLASILSPIQGKEPQWGILIHGKKSEIHKVKLGRGIAQVRRILQAINEVREAKTQPKLRLNSHCQICEFCQRCHAEAKAKDDLSLLRGMGEKEISKYNRRGIFTVTQLSCVFRPMKRAHNPKQKDQPHQYALQAIAIREQKIYVLGSPEVPDCTVRIFFDVEGDPERGFDYLLGMIIEAGGVEKHYSFWADGPADEDRIFQQFLDVVSAHEDYRIYAYGNYEAAFLRRMMKMPCSEEQVKGVMARLVNVLSIIRAHIYFPTYSNGLKDIGRYLGFDWTEPDASGIQSIVWRRTWEEEHSIGLKMKLVTYNSEDCAALKKVTQFLDAICPSRAPTLNPKEMVSIDGHPVWQVEQIDSQSSRREWCNAIFAIQDFEFVNERAYFDYQQDKVFIRTDKNKNQRVVRQHKRKGKKRLPANRTVHIASDECPKCGGSDFSIRQHHGLVRTAYDLRFTRSGIRRNITHYTSSWHRCRQCKIEFLPEKYLRLEEHCHSLKSWAMYMHVAHRMTFDSIAETLRDCYGLPIYTPNIWPWKASLARYYEGTYRRLLEKMLAGPVIHADETDVHLTRVGKSYVWVFSSLDEVVYMYRESREGGFLCELFNGFQGVLVSDFYAAYDSIDCKQQKCLIHLMRDFNQDLLANPWDEELKDLGSQFGVLIRSIVASVDRYGLRTRHLHKHHREVDKFYAGISKPEGGRSEIADGYRARLIKCRSKLFTFLDHDDVPWNNNNAEHAIKRFAKYRALADGRFGKAGLNDYLILLSMFVTCEFKRVDFLRFLLSLETDIDNYERRMSKVIPAPTLEVYPVSPDGGLCGNYRSRNKTWERHHLRNQNQMGDG